MCYKLIFSYETKIARCSFVTCVQCSEDNLNGAIRDIASEQNIPDGYDVKVEKTTLKKLAEEERSRVFDELEDQYLLVKYGSQIFDSEEYTKLKFKQSNDNSAVRNRCAELRKYLCACQAVRQSYDSEKITVAEFDKKVSELINEQNG